MDQAGEGCEEAEMPTKSEHRGGIWEGSEGTQRHLRGVLDHLEAPESHGRRHLGDDRAQKPCVSEYCRHFLLKIVDFHCTAGYFCSKFFLK